MTLGRIHSLESMGLVDGPGVRSVVFFQGCPLRCLYCHNPDTQRGGGQEISAQELCRRLVRFRPYFGDSGGVTFSGGEPFCQPEALCMVGRRIKEMGKHLTVYTGYTLECLRQLQETRPAVGELLELADLLVDGPYLEEERDLTLRFRGSANQRVIDLQKSREQNTVILYRDEYVQGL